MLCCIAASLRGLLHTFYSVPYHNSMQSYDQIMPACQVAPFSLAGTSNTSCPMHACMHVRHISMHSYKQIMPYACIHAGIYDPSSPIPFRSMAVLKERLDLSLVTHRVTRALTLRQRLFPNPQVTNGYRLFNGEGDGLPGKLALPAHCCTMPTRKTAGT